MRPLTYLCLLLPFFMLGQHTISGSFSPAEEFSYVLLYRATPSKTDYIGQAKLSDDGAFSIELDANQPPGIYKIVYAIPQEENNFNLIYNGKEDIVVHYDLEEGLTVSQSQNNILWLDYMSHMMAINQHIGALYSKEPVDKKALEEVFEEQGNIQETFEKKSNGLLVEAFIKANKMYVPKTYEPISEYGTLLKAEYLNYIDFENPLIQSSDFLLDRLMAYVLEMTPENPDAYKKAIDEVVGKVGNHQEVKKIILEMLWQSMTEKSQDDVANYISDQYLMAIAKQEKDTYLLKMLSAYKNTSVGKVAKDFNISYGLNGESVTTTLHDLSGYDSYLLIFWSSGCGHCLAELPQVKAFMESHPKVGVVAFGLEEGYADWKSEIKNYPHFFHAIGLGRWENPTAIEYGISSTPTYFVLDHDNKVLFKPYDLEAVKAYFGNN